LITTLGTRHKVKQIMANVFIQRFLTFFVLASFLGFLTFFNIFLERFYMYGLLYKRATNK